MRRCYGAAFATGGRRSVGACWLMRFLLLQQAPTERRPPRHRSFGFDRATPSAGLPWSCATGAGPHRRA